MGKCVIIGAADIKDYARAKNYLRKDDFYIFCDAGLKHTEALGMKPDLIIGDFDSYSKEEALKQGIETIVLPCEKDDTDTVFAVKEALRRNFAEFLLVGVIGGIAMGISAVWQGIAGAAACDAFAENGKGFTNQLMVLGIVETVAIFVMAFAIVLLGKI